MKHWKDGGGLIISSPLSFYPTLMPIAFKPWVMGVFEPQLAHSSFYQKGSRIAEDKDRRESKGVAASWGTEFVTQATYFPPVWSEEKDEYNNGYFA